MATRKPADSAANDLIPPRPSLTSLKNAAAGCTAEAHEFAEASPEFAKFGAQVVGMTGGNVDRIKEFSKSECRDKFAVGAASADVIKGYDVALATRPGWTNRTSYVIAPDGKILMAYTDGNFAQHVAKSMEAVKAYKAAKR
jgi:peroxiredoxin